MTETAKYLETAITVWENLTQQQKDTLLKNTNFISFDKGKIVHNGQTDCIGIIILKKGGLRTYILSEDGREITLFRITEGEICTLSASCVLNEITFDVIIETEIDSDVYVINPLAFQRVACENIYMENFANKLTVERFSDVMWAMEQILFMSFDKRLAIFLLDEMSKTGEDSIFLTHEQIAKYMGSAREVVTRMLKYFSNEGIVELSRGCVTIINKDKLRSLTI
ncbi:MAG: Crp/Fnr family transcriptional regulator [Clostridiales bacterium]|nr:Crp/Fnr family transcriptional regulator [Clostridiales bacterium]